MCSNRTHEIEPMFIDVVSSLAVSPLRIAYIGLIYHAVTCLHENYILMNLLKQLDTDDIRI